MNKKSAVPEYIWYISLIIIAITLVVGIVNITKKANKNIQPPSNLNVQFDVQIDPNNVVRLKTLDFIGSFDLEKDTPNLHLCCGGSCKNLMELFLAKKPTDLFTRKVSGAIGLKDMNGLILGKNGKAMLFDGKSGYIEIPDSDSLDITGPITEIAIIHPFSIRVMEIIQKRSSYNLWVMSSPNAVRIADDNGHGVTSESFLIPNHTYYLIELFKGTKGDTISTNNIAIYSNAKKLRVTGGGTWNSRVNNNPLRVGATIDNRTFFQGTIDEVRIYNRALSDEEIKQCFLGNCPNDDSLVLYLDFDDCTAKDKSGHGNDGVIHGNVTCVDEGILSGVQLYYPRQCFDKGAIWQLYYGNPDEGGVMLAQDKVDRKWSMS